MEKEPLQLILGAILLVLVINSTILWAVVFSFHADNAGQESPETAPPGSTAGFPAGTIPVTAAPAPVNAQPVQKIAGSPGIADSSRITVSMNGAPAPALTITTPRISAAPAPARSINTLPANTAAPALPITTPAINAAAPGLSMNTRVNASAPALPVTTPAVNADAPGRSINSPGLNGATPGLSINTAMVNAAPAPAVAAQPYTVQDNLPSPAGVHPDAKTAAVQPGKPGLPGLDSTGKTVTGPALNRAVALPDPSLNVTSRGAQGAQSRARTLASYVSQELPEEIRETHSVIQQDIPAPDYSDHVIVYSLVNETLPARLPRVSVNLVRPPLVIDYRVSPLPIVDVKYVEYKTGHTMHNETFHIHRYYENSWFQITVRNKDTGEIVDEDGVGRTYFLDDQPRQLVVRTCGNYSIEFGGEDTTVSLNVRVMDNGILPME